MTFVIYTLPRSRSYWLSRFLSYGDWYCGHDEVRHCRSLEDVASWLSQPKTGTCETSAAPFWRLVPDIKTVVVRRPVDEVVRSISRLRATDQRVFTRWIERYDRKLEQIEHRVPGVLSVKFHELADEATCKRIFEFCLPYKHDHRWWEAMDKLNLQANLEHYNRYTIAHYRQLDKLAKLARFRCIATMRPRVDKPDDGFVFAEEPLANIAEAKHLIEAHCVAAGEAPDYGEHINLNLLHDLEDIGALQIMTARSNGRLFGYLLTVISPSLEHGKLVGTQQAVFVSEDARGLGMRLHRAATDRLREKGVHETFFRAGTRASGARAGLLFQRLGAEPFGQWYRLRL